MGNQQTFEKFDRFEDLPKPVLQEILLKLNRQQLHAICSISRKAFSICSENNFREMYNQSHSKQMIYGDVHKSFQRNEPHTYTRIDFFDDVGSKISVVYYSNYKINYFEYIGNSSSINKNIKFTYHDSLKGFVTFNEVLKGDREDLLIRLKEIGKENWINKIKYNKRKMAFVFSKDLAEEMLEIIKNAGKKLTLEFERLKI